MMLTGLKTAFFLFLQAEKEENHPVMMVNDLSSIPEKKDKNVSYLNHDTVWNVKRSACPLVSFRTELAARIYASGYTLDLAEAVDGIPEKRQKEVTSKFKCQKLIDLRLPWLTVKPDSNQQKERIISGKFK